MTLRRRDMLGLAALGLATTSVAAADAGTGWQPQQPIRLVLPVAPGGTADASVRLIQPLLAQALGVPIVIDNRPGGMGTIGAEAVVRAKSDGSVIGLVNTQYPATPYMLQKIGFDTLRDITPIGYFWRAVLALSVRADAPWRSLDDLIRAAKAAPGRIAYGSGGVGQGSHFAVALLEQAAGIRLEHTPYKGAAPAMNDVLAGHVPLLTSGVATVKPYVDSGRLRVLAVTTANRSVVLPQARTVAELGFAGFDVAEWYGIIGPAGLPPSIAARLNRAFSDVLRRPEVAAQFAQLDLSARDMTPAQFGDYLAGEDRRMKQLVRDSGISAN